MRKILTFLAIILTFGITNAQQLRWATTVSSGTDPQTKEKKKSFLNTSVKDATWKRDLGDCFVIPYDSEGNPGDTIKSSGYKLNGSYAVKMSNVSIPVMVGDTMVVFEAGAPGYETQTICWTFEPLSKREVSRNMPPIYLSKARQLKEVTVTASKVKFYNKGDTIVYDADAFQLAEGSMLDALISQLPGAKIDENGRITVNGEFVEELLLNGKDFFNSDHSLMLENIPAYTVKTIEVYKGNTTEEKMNFDKSIPRHLIMDVKLKKEYSYGWLLNLQGGYGTANRYLGRLFASWFSPTTSVVITGLSNNLNDNRTPGQSDSWTPEQMPSGTQRSHVGKISYAHESTDQKVNARGSVEINSASFDYSNSTSSTNFLSSGDTYQRRFDNSKSSRFSIDTWHRAYYTIERKHRLGADLRADYSKSDNNSRSVSGAFNRDYSDISQEALEAIYTDGTEDELQSIVNRALTRGEGSLRSGSVTFNPSFSYQLPHSNDRLNLNFFTQYITSKRYKWDDYNINFGNDATPAERRRQYTDEAPNHKINLGATLGYSRYMRNGYFNLSYNYEFVDHAKDSYMYALDRLNDMGAFGVLPEEYASTLDPANSYTSRTLTSSHQLKLNYNWTKVADKYSLMFMFAPGVGVDHHHFDYWRENRSYLVKRTSFIMPRGAASTMLRYSFHKSSPEQTGNAFDHILGYGFNLSTDQPELLHLVDVVTDSDPLNIQEGNPDLHNSLTQAHSIFWTYNPFGRSLGHGLAFTYSRIHNNLVRGYIYDTATGVRRFKTYNVDGNDSFTANDYLNWEFGKQKQFTLTAVTTYSLMNSTDMVGINMDLPAKTQVQNQSISEDLTFSYRIGRQMLQANASVTNRHTTSESQDFNTINAQHFKYGINGVFSLPKGFGLSTDIFFYKRNGYGVKELDSTDAVWNLRFSYTPPKSKWVFTADGFDLLHKLSNVHYAVTATGRTVSYSNTLPRYFLLTVQYRLNIQPKK